MLFRTPRTTAPASQAPRGTLKFRARPAPRVTVTVREATRADADAFLGLVDALAEYEKLDPPAADARERLVEDAFAEDPSARRVKVLLGESEGRAVAYAILCETYSSFLARPTLYLEDVFVAPDARMRGVGKAMMRAVAQEAEARGCHRIEGVVLSWNDLAHGFYAATGGDVKRDWFLLRYDRAGIERLARSE